VVSPAFGAAVGKGILRRMIGLRPMILLTLEIDTQTAAWPACKRAIGEGQMIRAEGIINTRHEEFSALDLAREAGLHNVVWDALQDDTCGSLELTILYPYSTSEEITARVSDLDSLHYLIGYEVTETVDRQTAVTDC
jgi:hypothetical protein